MSVNIWPRRTFQGEPVNGLAGAAPSMSISEAEIAVEAIMQSGITPLRDVLDQPAHLGGGERLLALILIGDDGIGGNGSLLVRVAAAPRPRHHPSFDLTVVPYGRVASSGDLPRIKPARAAVILDTFAGALKAQPKLARFFEEPMRALRD